MRSAFCAAVLILARAWVLPRIGTYLGSNSLSMSTPSSLFGRSMMWPLEARTEKLRPRNLFSVRDLAGDSTMTSDLPPPPTALPATFVLPLALPLAAGVVALPSPPDEAAAFPVVRLRAGFAGDPSVDARGVAASELLAAPRERGLPSVRD